MKNSDYVSMVGRERDALPWSTVDDHVVMIIVQFRRWAWPWSGERSEDMQKFDLRAV